MIVARVEFKDSKFFVVDSSGVIYPERFKRREDALVYMRKIQKQLNLKKETNHEIDQ